MPRRTDAASISGLHCRRRRLESHSWINGGIGFRPSSPVPVKIEVGYIRSVDEGVWLLGESGESPCFRLRFDGEILADGSARGFSAWGDVSVSARYRKRGVCVCRSSDSLSLGLIESRIEICRRFVSRTRDKTKEGGMNFLRCRFSGMIRTKHGICLLAIRCPADESKGKRPFPSFRRRR